MAASARGYPPPPGGTVALLVDDVGLDPRERDVADPGFSAVSPGSGVIMMAPVSVCHHVSTTGHRSPPITFQYHTQASGLIGSPTEPAAAATTDRAASGTRSPHRMNARMAVGAV